MRVLVGGVICAFALVAVGALGAEGGVQGSSRTSTTVGVPMAGPSVTTGGGTKAGELEKQAGMAKSDAGSDGRSLGRHFGSYFLGRWYDLVDIVDFSFGAGPGLMVNVHATKLCQAMGGWSDAYRIGFRGRSAGIWREKRKEVGVSLLYYQKVQREHITGWVESFRTEKMDLDTSTVYANNNDRSFFGVGATIQAGILVDVNVRPIQAVDFVLGWLTVDVLEDDTGRPKRNKDL